MSSGVSAKRMRVEGASRLSSVEGRLRRLALELEQVPTKDVHAAAYAPSYRATLARQGYLVQRNLGSGSYSKVKTALNCRTTEHIPVAVKIIDKSHAPREYQHKFLPRELETWPKLKHPGIVQLYQTFQDSRYLFMVMEFAPRGDALRYVQKNGALEEPLARSWSLQLAEAILYLHRQNIAHRDLKLENLLLDHNGRLKLADFGFVKEQCGSSLSHTYCGSKSYAAPEILEGRPYPPSKADVWAFGVIIYILVTGRMPFDESRGTMSILAEQRVLGFDWNKHRQVAPTCRDVITDAFIYQFQERPCMTQLVAQTWFQTRGSHVTMSYSARRFPGVSTTQRLKRTASAQRTRHYSL